MNNICFSLLICAYYKDSCDALIECFESIVIKSNILPNEIVLVKDGKLTTELDNVIDTWKYNLGERLQIIALPQNIGLGKALNEGLKHCRYDWVFRMDSDDICTPDRFQKQVEFIQNNPDVVLVGGQIQEFGTSLADLKHIRSVPTTNSEIRQQIGRKNPFNHMTVAYRRDVVTQLGAYQHHLFMEDYNLWLRVVGAGYKVANLPDIVVYARVGNGMHARRRGWQYIKSEKQLLDLKITLKIQSRFSAWGLFLMRSSFRLLPSRILEQLYNSLLRK